MQPTLPKIGQGGLGQNYEDKYCGPTRNIGCEIGSINLAVIYSKIFFENCIDRDFYF